MNRMRVVVVALLAAGALLAACVAGAAWQAHGQGQPPASPPDGWRTFEGSWSATGSLQALPTEGNRPAAIVRLSGALVLSSGAGLGRGFHGEAIGFDDGGTVHVGRAVWTDQGGDRIYSELKGEPVQTGRRVFGTITGGTGRYAGLTGDFAFTWQYVVQAEEGQVQGRTVGLEGKVRFAEARQ